MFIKMANKTGQFYLIAAIVIVVVLFGLVTVTNKIITKPSETDTYQLSKELNLEGESVINYGVLNDKNIDQQLVTFTQDYGKYIGESSDVYFVYGNKEGIKATIYQRVEAGSVSLGDSRIDITAGAVKVEDYPEVETDKPIEIEISGKKYTFDLKEGENFFFIIKEQKIPKADQ